ncbi:putative ABC transporter [Aspergillus unguis]
MLRLPTLRARAFRPCSFRSHFRLVSTAPPLIRIKDATFYKNYPTAEDEAKGTNLPLFPNLNFTLPSAPGKEGPQHWAVIGHPARSEFLDVIRGSNICIPPNARSYPYLLTDEIAKKDPRLRYPGNTIQYIGFSGEGSNAIGGTRGAYLSARYESLREETDWTVEQYLRGQTSLNPLEEERKGTVHDESLFSQVTTELRLGELLDMPVANLSNGQTRRTRIAKALLGKPELLLLDDPFMGLDPATVRSISGLLHRLAEKADPRLVLSLRPQDRIPDWITHLLVVGKSNSVVFQGPRTEAEEVFGVWRFLAQTGGSRRYGEDDYQQLRAQAQADMDSGKLDKQLIYDLHSNNKKVKTPDMAIIKDGEPLVEMDGVRVQYGDKVVLGNWAQNIRQKPKEGLSWTVRRGQRWAILGPNGSGKTTLLSLITSDHPQAYALPIKLFGRSRLPEPGKPAISLFELQSRLGHSSPEIHAFFPRQLTIREAVESAFAETFLSKPSLNYEHDLDVSAALRFFKPELDLNYDKEDPSSSVVSINKKHFPKMKRNYDKQSFFLPDHEVDYADSITFGQLSTSQQRLVLFLRALIHKPDIIILDEPFSGMSSSVRDKCIHFLEAGEHFSVQTTAIRRAGGKNPWSRGLLSETKAEAKSGAGSDSPVSTSEGEKAQEPKLPRPKGYIKKADRHKYEGFEEAETTKTIPKPPTPPKRHTGISDDQALIMISHLREEIPDIVRHYMRLPTTAEGDESGLDFRFGYLKLQSTLSAPDVWDLAWTPGDQFVKKGARKNFRRVDPNKKDKEIDENVFEWYSI